MRRAKIFYNNHIFVGELIEKEKNLNYIIQYDDNYNGPPISLTLPITKKYYEFSKFPAYFEGVLPEGLRLESLLKLKKLNRDDLFGQLMSVGKDLVGAFSVQEVSDD